MLRKLSMIVALGALVTFPAAALAHGHGGGHGGHGGGGRGGGWGGGWGGYGPFWDYGPDYDYGYPGYAPGYYYPGCHLHKHWVVRNHHRVARWVRVCH
jgi:hypothetical protein